MSHIGRRLGLTILFVVVGSQYGLAQETRGSITGRVTDSSGAVVPNVRIEATNKATGLKLSTLSNEVGNYRLDFLLPGPYEVTTTAPNFKTVTRALEIRTGDSIQVDIVLEVGEVTEKVMVTGMAPLLETTNADRGQVIDNRRIDTLPLAQGNTTFLINIAPGANPGTSSDLFKYDEPGFEVVGGFSFHGAPRGTMGFTLNGIANNLSRTGSGQAGNVQPPADAVHEMKISQSYDSRHGHDSGTSIDIALKSGTRDLHGTGYGYFRDTALNAKSFLDNRAGNRKPVSEYRRAGFSVTGPVYIPKLQPRRDRTFFSYTFEDTHEEYLELPGTLTIPWPEQLRGDFSKLLQLGPQYQIYDPLTTTPTGDGFFRRAPFPGNIIPQERLNPIAQQLARYWPQPNLAGARDGSNNYQPSSPEPTDFYQSFVRVDHTVSPNHRLFFQHGLLSHLGRWQDNYGTLATGLRERIRRQNIGLDYVWVARPNLLFNFRYGVTRLGHTMWHKSHLLDDSGGFDITTLGLAPEVISQLDLTQGALPHVFVTGYTGLHDNTRRRLNGVDVHSVDAETGYSRGSHNITGGFEFRSSRNNLADATFLMPRYNFGTDFTNGPLNTSAAAPIGQGLAAFLLGQPTGGSVQRKDSFAAANPDYSFFVQDSWRATRRLTLNLGLRYENYLAVTERYNRSVRGFDAAAPSPIEAAARTAYAANPIPELPLDRFQVHGGYTFAGVGGQPSELYDAPGSVVAPRLGFGYQLSGNTVLRGGYGIYFVPTGLTSNINFFPLQAGFNRTTELVPSLDNGVSFVADMRNPFPGGILRALKTAGGLATDLGQNVSFFNTTNLKAPHLQRWSVTVQRILPNDTVIEAGYVASRGTKLIIPRNLNYLPSQYLSDLPHRDERTISLLTQAVPNPFFGLLPGSALNTRVIGRDQLLRPFPQFRSVTLGQDSQGYSWYHALEGKVEKRFAKGHSYILSYTWSKNMEAMNRLDDSDPLPYESLSAIDRTHILSLTAVWELPFGQGRRFGGNSHPALSKVISGWEVSSVWHAMSGSPLTFPDLFTTTNLAEPALPEGERSVERWFNTDAGFVRDVRQQPAFHRRTFPFRFGTLRTDGINTWDISLLKNTRITERVNVQFLGQFLNAFNHASFGNVNTSPSSGSFGAVTSEFVWPRRIMLGLKASF